MNNVNKYRLIFESDNYGQYFKPLNQVIINIIKNKGMKLSQFIELIFEDYKRNHPLVNYKHACGHRYRVISAIFGIRPLSTKQFEYILVNILKDSIYDQEIKQLVLIGAGEDLRGHYFGKLKVVECLGKNNNRKVIWKCLCNCG